MSENTVKYSENGFWIKKEADKYIIGLSEKGHDDLGEVSFIDLPETGAIKTTDTLIGVEAAKAMTDLASPLAGTITAVNEALENNPENLNSTDATVNWIVELTDVSAEAFEALQNEPGLQKNAKR